MSTEEVGASNPASRSPPAKGSVFLSYASEDAAAAERIATALRTAGIEVWFDQSELRGGDAWDRQIRQQIHDCRLFIALISTHTEARDEGYFRREWRLAVDRTHDMAERKAFLVPVVIDATLERGASVPDKFRELQWTRLPGGEASAAFVALVRGLLSPEAPATRRSSPGPTTLRPQTIVPNSGSSRRVLWIAVLIAALGVTAYLAYQHPWAAKPAAPAPTAAGQPATTSAFNPPLHSIAVLPFVNMSADKEQEYFSDGLTEEVLNSLAEINELQVAARTSAFSFKGKDADIGTIARKLNVGAVLEGSVRRSGNTVRVTIQLINAVTGFHLWSHTYDRDLGDVLRLETEIAGAVASALKVTLLGDLATRIELGGTRNPVAFDAYLRAWKLASAYHDGKEVQAALGMYSEAVRLDPNYALAFAGRSEAYSTYGGLYATGADEAHQAFEKALADAQHAIALAAQLPEGHLALAEALKWGFLDFSGARDAIDRARVLAPSSAQVLGQSGRFAIAMGDFDAGITALRRAVELDPLNPDSEHRLGLGLYAARRYGEAVSAFSRTLSIDPSFNTAYATRGLVYYLLGDLQRARSSCETKPNTGHGQWCLALVYNRLGRRAEAQAVVEKYEHSSGDASAYQYSTIFAQWGDRSAALDWLDTAMRVHDSGLEFLKVDPLMDPIRKEPRFQAIERRLKFAN